MSQKCLLSLAVHMKEVNLMPNQILFNQGEFDDKLYYLHQGVLEVYMERSSDQF